MTELVAGIDEQALLAFITEQRWFGSKSRAVAHAHVIDEVPVRESAPPYASAALVEVRFQPGTHEIYQLLLGGRPAEEGWNEGVIAQSDDLTVYDAFADPALARELVHLMRGSTTLAGDEGSIELRPVDGLAEHGHELWQIRSVAAEQSNTSVVFDEELILKAYRRLEAGINPELELLRFLTMHGFPNIAPLVGWYWYTGRPMEVTLGILQQFVQGERDGWELALDALASEPEDFLRHVRRLGEVTGAMHSALGSDPGDPSFAPEEPSHEALALLVASVDEEIEQVFLDLPVGDPDLEPIAGRGEEVREQLRTLSHIGPVGRVIRHHGDYHLGQVLWTGADWVVLDFEGEPARGLAERRQKRSPLRDVAGMLRSFAYAASASELLRGVIAPDDFEERARSDFLEGYLAEVDPSLLPSGSDAIERLLTVFELEKAVYELRYELDNRPDWVRIPVAGIERMLRASVP